MMRPCRGRQIPNDAKQFFFAPGRLDPDRARAVNELRSKFPLAAGAASTVLNVGAAKRGGQGDSSSSGSAREFPHGPIKGKQTPQPKPHAAAQGLAKKCSSEVLAVPTFNFQLPTLPLKRFLSAIHARRR